MQMFPFRQSLARLTIGRDLQGVTYYVVTYVSLFAMCGVAILSGSIWKPLQLVGATAGKKCLIVISRANFYIYAFFYW